MKNQLALPTLVAGTTLLGALSYLLIKPKKATTKRLNTVEIKFEDNSNEYFI